MIYTEKLILPTQYNTLVVKLFATNGVVDSSVITLEYNGQSNIPGVRFPRTTTSDDCNTSKNYFPFGSQNYQQKTVWLTPNDAGENLFDPDLPSQPTGFDADGYSNAYTNKPFNLQNYDIVYSTTNEIGETGYGRGNYPNKSERIIPEVPPMFSIYYSDVFNPSAMVIFHDVSKESAKYPALINKENYSLGHDEASWDSIKFSSFGLDAAPLTGHFIRQQYNEVTKIMTYYYRDSNTNQWIISKVPYEYPGREPENYHIKNLRKNGAQYVYRWHLFTRRYR
jgi:hypothetical protein